MSQILCLGTPAEDRKIMNTPDKNPICQNIQIRRIDKYTNRSKNIQQKHQHEVQNWVKNVFSQLQINRDALKKINKKRYKRQLSQKAIGQPSISDQKSGLDPQLATSDGPQHEKIDLEDCKVQIQETHRHNQNNLPTSVTLNPTKINDSQSVRHKKPKIKFDFMNTPRRILVKERGSKSKGIIHFLNPNKEIKKNEKYKIFSPRKNSVELHQNKISEFQNIQHLKTTDKEEKLENLGLPDDSNYNKIVNFMESLKKSIEIQHNMPENNSSKRPNIIVQNFFKEKSQNPIKNLKNHIKESKEISVKRSLRVKRSKELLEIGSCGALNRCETPNTIPSIGITQNHSSTPGRNKRSASFTKIRTRIGAVTINSEINRAKSIANEPSSKKVKQKVKEIINTLNLDERYKIIATPKLKEKNVKPKKPIESENKGRSEESKKFRHARKLLSEGREINGFSKENLSIEIMDFEEIKKKLNIMDSENLALQPDLKESRPNFKLLMSQKSVSFWGLFGIEFKL